MDRYKAKNWVWENHPTAGQLVAHIRKCGVQPTSKVNKSLPPQMAYDILLKAVESAPPDRDMTSSNGAEIIATNIVREFGIPEEA